MKILDSLAHLSEHELREQLAALVDQDRRTTAELLRYIDEVDRRELWAADGYPSMFAYCLGRFQMSESMAGKRICAARVGRRFPIVFEMLARGETHLSTLCLLSKHLSVENHLTVLERAKHKTRVEVEKLIAELAPKPDARARIVALPLRTSSFVTGSTVPAHAPGHVVALTELSLSVPERSLPGRVTPLAPERYKLQVTIGQETHDKLRQLQGLLSHAIPNGDPSAIIDRALDVLLEETLKNKAAVVNKPRGERQSKHGGRRLSAPVRRTVWDRDHGSCAFTSSSGRRCGETRFVEFHHKEPYAKGGASDVANIELRCRAHNQHEANRDYGALFMNQKRQATTLRDVVTTYRREAPRRSHRRHPKSAAGTESHAACGRWAS